MRRRPCWKPPNAKSGKICFYCSLWIQADRDRQKQRHDPRTLYGSLAPPDVTNSRAQFSLTRCSYCLHTSMFLIISWFMVYCVCVLSCETVPRLFLRRVYVIGTFVEDFSILVFTLLALSELTFVYQVKIITQKYVLMCVIHSPESHLP